MIDKTFWQNKRIFITGHTGFKGSWLCLWLHKLGADITGYSLLPPTTPSLYELCEIDKFIHSIIGDVRDKEKLLEAVVNAKPHIIIHMAAQPLVRASYQNPSETFEINVMGTVNLLEAVRAAVQAGSPVQAVINVTTDKCYENKEWVWGYREQDALGGYDPYSNSKACSEFVTASYRASFFSTADYGRHGVAIASARAGNVIGGGDWAVDRLIPDAMRSLLCGEKIKVRHPAAVRPWQHVLEPLGGYMLLAQKLCEDGRRYAGSWNFGPEDDDAKPVEWIVNRLCEKWGGHSAYQVEPDAIFHEAQFLKLDCSKAKGELGWQPTWNLEVALDQTIEWTKVYQGNRNLLEQSLEQIDQFSVAISKESKLRAGKIEEGE